MRKSVEPSQDEIGIYKIVSPSGASYVGMTMDSFKSRWASHLRELRRGNHHCVALQRAFNKYSEDSLSFEILQTVDSLTTGKSIHLLEQFWWDKLHSEDVKLYNGRPTGRGSVHHTMESKNKISSTRKARYPKSQITVECPACKKTFLMDLRSFKKGLKTCSEKCKNQNKRNNPPKTRSIYTYEKMIEDLYLSGKGIREICRVHNFNRNIVSNHLKSVGLVINPQLKKRKIEME